LGAGKGLLLLADTKILKAVHLLHAGILGRGVAPPLFEWYTEAEKASGRIRSGFLQAGGFGQRGADAASPLKTRF
jgi:hypothetical protein